VENQAWVVGVNRVGTDKDATPYYGHSAAYDFMGRKMADCLQEECVRIVDIEPSKIAAFRERFRAWQDADKIEIK
jgi:predicted amidohydrolase